MTRYELEGIRIPVDNFGITIEELPVKLRPVMPQVENAAKIGGELYALQMHYLEQNLDLVVSSADNRARNPFTVPTKEGRFVDFFEHPSFRPLLLDAQRVLINASESARTSEDNALAEYLWRHAINLTSAGYDEILGECVKLRSRINFHLLPVETEYGKRIWQGYAAIDDQEETREVRKDIEALREAGIRRNGSWFSPRTDIRVDNVSVMSGWLGTEAQRQRMGFNRVLPEQGGISAENIPNESELVRKYGTRIAIFAGPFNNYTYPEIIRLVKDFTDLQIQRRWALRFIAAHEFSHDERYDDSRERLGDFNTALRESYANVAGIDLSADVWNPENNSFMFGTVVRGATGYAFRDCHDIIMAAETLGGQYPDLGILAKRSAYIPGNLSLLNLWVNEGVYTVRNGKIVAINSEKAYETASRLAKEQQKILSSGTEQDVRDHFEGILPKKSFLVEQNSDIDAAIA